MAEPRIDVAEDAPPGGEGRELDFSSDEDEYGRLRPAPARRHDGVGRPRRGAGHPRGGPHAGGAGGAPDRRAPAAAFPEHGHAGAAAARLGAQEGTGTVLSGRRRIGELNDSVLIVNSDPVVIDR